MSITTLTAATSRRLTSVNAVIQDISPEGLGGNLLLVESLIDHASAAIERACGRIFAQQTYAEITDMHQETLLILSKSPVVTVTSALLDQTVITDYRIHSMEAGLLFRRHGWWQWTETPDVTVTYTAGYLVPGQVAATAPVPLGPTLPGDLERAAIECVKVWLHERVPSDRIASKTFGLTGDRIDYGISAMRTAIPVLAQRLLDPWRRVALA